MDEHVTYRWVQVEKKLGPKAQLDVPPPPQKKGIVYNNN